MSSWEPQNVVSHPTEVSGKRLRLSFLVQGWDQKRVLPPTSVNQAFALLPSFPPDFQAIAPVQETGGEASFFSLSFHTPGGRISL